jgi:hypothetical protein
MNIRKRIDDWIFKKDLKRAKKFFEKVRRSSIYNEAPRLERRNYIKAIIRAAGFKKIRIKERLDR